MSIWGNCQLQKPSGWGLRHPRSAATVRSRQCWVDWKQKWLQMLAVTRTIARWVSMRPTTYPSTRTPSHSTLQRHRKLKSSMITLHNSMPSTDQCCLRLACWVQKQERADCPRSIPRWKEILRRWHRVTAMLIGGAIRRALRWSGIESKKPYAIEARASQKWMTKLSTDSTRRMWTPVPYPTTTLITKQSRSTPRTLKLGTQ